MFKSIEKNVNAEIVEKKSKFIANIYVINNKEEAEKILKDVRKEYYDARHNCYAYILKDTEKCSDDGEPSGTAGAPLLELLKVNNLKNVLIVVTRYFGGVLLGTGGLVRAYTLSAKKALENANIIEKEYGIRYKVEIEYGELKNLQHICKKLEIKISKIEYKMRIIATLESNIEKKAALDNSNVKLLKEFIEDEDIIISSL